MTACCLHFIYEYSNLLSQKIENTQHGMLRTFKRERDRCFGGDGIGVVLFEMEKCGSRLPFFDPRHATRGCVENGAIISNSSSAVRIGEGQCHEGIRRPARLG